MKKIHKIFPLFLCLCALCCSCTFPHKRGNGKPQTIYYDLPADDSIFADMDMVNLSGYYTYHYDKAKNLVQTNYYCPRDTDDGSWGWHERSIYTYDNNRRLIKEQLFLPYVDNDTPWTETNYTYFPDGYSTTYTYSDGGITESYYNTDGDLLLHRDGVHHPQMYSYSYEYNTEEDSVEEYLQFGNDPPFLHWKQFASGENEKIEIKYYSWGVPEIFWVNTYNDAGERISGNWCLSEDLPGNLSAAEYMWRDCCRPGYRTRYEDGKLMEEAQQEWNLNIDGVRTEYTLYDYNKDGNLALKLVYNRLYNEKINLYRYEYDCWGCMVKQYKYDIDFKRYKEWSLPLSDGGSFYFSYGTDKTLIMKRLSAAQETLSAVHCKNGQFHVQYIGEEEIKWR